MLYIKIKQLVDLYIRKNLVIFSEIKKTFLKMQNGNTTHQSH